MNQTISKLIYNAKEEQRQLTNIHVLLENLEEKNNMNKTIDFRNNSDNNDEETIVFNQIDFNTNGELVESTVKDLFKHQTAKGGTETKPIIGGVNVTNLKIVKPSKELVIAKLEQKEIKHDPETLQKTIDKVESEKVLLINQISSQKKTLNIVLLVVALLIIIIVFFIYNISK